MTVKRSAKERRLHKIYSWSVYLIEKLPNGRVVLLNVYGMPLGVKGESTCLSVSDLDKLKNEYAFEYTITKKDMLFFGKDNISIDVMGGVLINVFNLFDKEKIANLASEEAIDYEKKLNYIADTFGNEVVSETTWLIMY